MFELINQGGPVMWLILGCSVIAALAFVDRVFHLHRAQIKTQDFLDGIYNVLRRGNVVEAVSLCEETPGPVAHVVRAAVLKSDDSVEDISKAIHHAGLGEIPRLEKYLPLLATFAKILPLLGLLGTVLGMVDTFYALHVNAPLAHAGDLAGGLQQAFTSTAAGLTVAIICYAGYNLLVSRVQNIVMDMERASSEILSFLAKLKQSGKRGEVS